VKIRDIIHALYPPALLACAITLFVLKLSGLDSITKYLIPVFVLGICLYSLQGNTPGAPGDRLISLALFFAFIGDFIINLTPIPSVCIISFALTHLCLTAYYFTGKKFNRSELPALVL
jgi:uncharacterized membrane protein YhhN